MRSGLIILCLVLFIFSCGETNTEKEKKTEKTAVEDTIAFKPDTTKIPNDKFGDMVRYGQRLMMKTAYYIGPEGVNGKYLGNRMNCTNCHQDGGTKPFAFILVRSHQNYPQYRAREAKVLSLAERVNNCVMRPHNGKPLPLDSKEMLAFLSYLKWINSQAPVDKPVLGEKLMHVEFPARAADPKKGEELYNKHCLRCHSANGEGQARGGAAGYLYPPLWGDAGYQPGSSMHRVIKQAQWIKANMPYDLAKWNKPILTDEEAFDIAAFVNDDRIHKRPSPKTFDYPHPEEKAIDYGHGPYADTFPELQHKFGPYQPIVDYWKSKGLKPVF